VGIICLLGNLYFVALFARIILSWFPIAPESPFAKIFGFLYSITEPVLGPVRRVLPPIGMGGMGLDLSPIIVFIGLQILLGAFGCGVGL
jgi:YggT family protein